MRTFFFLIILVVLNSCRNSEVKKNQKKIEKSAFPRERIIGLWSEHENDSHADFEITKNHIHLFNYNPNLNGKYKIIGNKIKIHFPSSELEGSIVKVRNDSLTILWSYGMQYTYVRWKK